MNSLLFLCLLAVFGPAAIIVIVHLAQKGKARLGKVIVLAPVMAAWMIFSGVLFAFLFVLFFPRWI
jgi:hypothetical protein